MTNPDGVQYSCPFVVQEHHDAAGVHWDLMLRRPAGPATDDDAVLATWRLSVLPLPENLLQPQSARALPDHRMRYLTYEGPIGNNRGWCRIVDRGDYERLDSDPDPDSWRIRCAGRRLSGNFVLKKTGDPDAWTIQISD
jgi:hypothetical protein